MFKQFRRVAIACALLDGARAIEAHYIHLWLRDTGEKWKLAIASCSSRPV